VAAAPSAPVAAGPSGATTATPAQTSAAPAAVVPFVRGSGLGRYKFFSQAGLTLGSSPLDLGPIDVKAYDYMRSIIVTLTTTTAGTAASGSQVLSYDGPFNAFTNVMVKQPNGQTMYQVTSGHHAAMIHKYGGYAGYNDPRSYPSFNYQGTGTTAASMTFAFRIPFELNIRDALGALPNKNAAAPFELDLTLNTFTNVFPSGAGSPTSPTFTVECWLEAWDQPPTTLGGAPCQTTPPNVNTLQRWTEQQITLSGGNFDARIRKLGNYIREFIFMTQATGTTGATSSGYQRIGGPQSVAGSSTLEGYFPNGTGFAGTGIWPDPIQIVLDEDVKDNVSYQRWMNDIYEIWGYGGNNNLGVTASTGPGWAGPVLQNALPVNPQPGVDAPGGLDTGVFPKSYAHEFDGTFGHETGDLYLPTIESEDYLLRGNWGTPLAATGLKLICLVDEVLPQGNIFS